MPDNNQMRMSMTNLTQPQMQPPPANVTAKPPKNRSRGKKNANNAEAGVPPTQQPLPPSYSMIAPGVPNPAMLSQMRQPHPMGGAPYDPYAAQQWHQQQQQQQQQMQAGYGAPPPAGPGGQGALPQYRQPIPQQYNPSYQQIPPHQQQVSMGGGTLKFDPDQSELSPKL